MVGVPVLRQSSRRQLFVGLQAKRPSLPLSSPRTALSTSSAASVDATAVTSAAESSAPPPILKDVPLDSEVGVSYVPLQDLLAGGKWEAADNETRRLLCVLAGDGAAKRKWVYFSEVQFIPTTDLLTIDSLWRAYSDDKFGFSVQRRIWQTCGQRWKPFFLKIDWTYGEHSTYKKFPAEFQWTIDAPVGHLPLTNALRGTQLFDKLLNHPAFDKFDAETTIDEGAYTSKATSTASPLSMMEPKKNLLNSDPGF